MSKILRNQSDQNRLSIQKMLQNGSESKFARIIRVMKHCEIGKLQAASIVVLLPAFLAAFHVRTFFGISNFSEFRTFRNSESDFRNSMNSSVWHRSVYQIPIPNPISEFHRPLFIATCINKSQSRNWHTYTIFNPLYWRVDAFNAIPVTFLEKFLTAYCGNSFHGPLRGDSPSRAKIWNSDLL